MASPSVMTVKPNQLGFMSAPLNIQGTPFQGSYMPNPGWQFFIKGAITTRSVPARTSGVSGLQARND